MNIIIHLLPRNTISIKKSIFTYFNLTLHEEIGVYINHDLFTV